MLRRNLLKTIAGLATLPTVSQASNEPEVNEWTEEEALEIGEQIKEKSIHPAEAEQATILRADCLRVFVVTDHRPSKTIEHIAADEDLHIASISHIEYDNEESWSFVVEKAGINIVHKQAE